MNSGRLLKMKIEYLLNTIIQRGNSIYGCLIIARIIRLPRRVELVRLLLIVWIGNFAPEATNGSRMNDLTRAERLQIMLTEEELAALDDWRFASRMPSRAAAVRELLKRGLAAEGYSPNAARQRSKDYGVTNGASAKSPNGDGGNG